MTIDKNKAVNILVTLVITFVIFLIIQSLITRNTNLDLKNKPQKLFLLRGRNYKRLGFQIPGNKYNFLELFSF